MHYYELARVIQREKEQEIERRLRMGRPSRPPRRSLRQVVGRLLIRFGSMLAGDGQHEVGRLRSPGKPETQL
jgi:hypothetical protein